jgi:hypothetical protein
MFGVTGLPTELTVTQQINDYYPTVRRVTVVIGLTRRSRPVNVHGYIEARLILMAATPFLLFSLSDLFNNEGRQHGGLVLVWAAYSTNLTRLARWSRKCLAIGSAAASPSPISWIGGPSEFLSFGSPKRGITHCI